MARQRGGIAWLVQAVGIGVLVWGLLLVASPVIAQGPPRIVEPVVANSQRDLLLFLRLEGAITPEMESGVQNGLPVTFVFDVALEMVRTGWPDKEVYSGTFEHTLAYDSLKRQYSVRTTENRVENTMTDDLAEAKRLMAEVDGYRVLPLAGLQSDREYVLRVKGTVVRKTLPFSFRSLIPFTGARSVETDWRRVEFRY